MYQLHRGFVSEIECRELVRWADQLIEQQYTRENLVARVAYPSDKTDNRDSYAFAIHCPGSPVTRDLPGLPKEAMHPALSAVTSRVAEAMHVDNGRLLFNVQRYRDSSKEVPRHFDGEFFETVSRPDGTFDVRRGVRPKSVAILTLINRTVGGGTTLFPQDRTEAFVVGGRAGDLLVFDNIAYEHGVKSMVAMTGAGDTWARYVIGWRAIDAGCCAIESGNLSAGMLIADVAALHRQFLAREWPLRMEAALANALF